MLTPVSFSLVRSADTPADSLKAEFMVSDAQDWEQEIARIELQAEGRRLFRGICDRQIVGIDSAGCRLTVWARSDAAVLLDNEAIPQEYSCVTLDEMFAKHLAPYGFQSDLEGEGSLLGYQVGKGVSEWRPSPPSASGCWAGVRTSTSPASPSGCRAGRAEPFRQGRRSAR